MSLQADLHVDRYGDSGAPLLFIHGWGMHGGLWGGVLEELASQYRVMAVDLPGHGLSRRVGTTLCPRGTIEVWADKTPAHPALDAIVDQLAAQFSDIGPITVCGWSLGAQVALRWAMLYPLQVQRLVLVSATPCFVQQADWHCAMAANTLSAFSDALELNYLQTLRRFLSLQLRGSEQERELLATLRGGLLSRGEPDMATLQGGLNILRDCDLRASLPEIHQAALVIAGVRDTLTPLPAAQFLASRMPNARLAEIEGAAHAPFLSHPDEFVEQLVDFLHE